MFVSNMMELESLKGIHNGLLTSIACVSGSAGCGTTTFVRRFVDVTTTTGKNDDNERCFGARLYRRAFVVGTQELRFSVWDVSGVLAGAPQFYKIYTRGCRITMVVMDLSSLTSLHGAKLVIEALKLSPNGPRLVLVGCKSDIAVESVTQSAAAFAAENNILFVMACALQSQRSVQNAFFKAAKEQQSVRRPPKWVDDEMRPQCKICSRGFTLTRRRHHCRCCSDIFCDDCSRGKRPLPHFGFNTPVRCCDVCVRVLDLNE